ncbi:alpha/beta hydrolase family protein [Streptosporangium sp. NPDC004379]|uniref:alpha/beta hydrolase family protein n=1 Tax=Streptosporangium sp. NPDC004379 TaxID=3366189 RepID=UPI00368AC79F
MPVRRAAALTLSLSAAAAALTAVAASPSDAASSSGAAPAAAVELRLPAPSGPYAVGRDVLHLVDDTRTDPWVPSAGARRLMVSVYYPARTAGDGAAAPYMTTEEARLLLKAQGRDKLLAPEVLAGTRTNARTGARPAGGRHPLVLVSPGFSLNRATLTVLSEDLASRGYVVALVDHAYESFGTTFPDGRTLTCVACETVEGAPADGAEKGMMARVATGRATDLSFVLDALTGRRASAAARTSTAAQASTTAQAATAAQASTTAQAATAGDRTAGHRPAWKRSGMIDTRRIGAVGHSIGGNAAASLMAGDRRVRAGVNMDGTFFAPVPGSGLGGRPFMMLGTAAGHSPGSEDVSWSRDWARLDGWKRWLTVKDTGHFSFIDIPVLGRQLGVTDPEAPLPGDRSAEITTSYVGAFFDRHLRGKAQPLLDGPTPATPELTFHNP